MFHYASGSESSFTSQNKEILIKCGLHNVTLLKQSNVEKLVTIKWSQVARSFFGCKEDYSECQYYMEGEDASNVVKVFVAKKCGPAPDAFNTSRHSQNGGRLFFGYVYGGSDGKAIYFVIHPEDWRPYQHRFKTNDMISLLKQGASALGGSVGGYLGSTVPGTGTAAAGASGAWISKHLTAAVIGDFLRFIG